MDITAYTAHTYIDRGLIPLSVYYREDGLTTDRQGMTVTPTGIKDLKTFKGGFRAGKTPPTPKTHRPIYHIRSPRAVKLTGSRYNIRKEREMLIRLTEADYPDYVYVNIDRIEVISIGYNEHGNQITIIMIAGKQIKVKENINRILQVLCENGIKDKGV